MEKKQINMKQCEICENDATCLCLKCISYYCDSCFKLAHGKKTKNNHKKEKIDHFVPIDTKCPAHPLNPITLFCVEENGKYIITYLIFILLYRTLLWILYI